MKKLPLFLASLPIDVLFTWFFMSFIIIFFLGLLSQLTTKRA